MEPLGSVNFSFTKPRLSLPKNSLPEEEASFSPKDMSIIDKSKHGWKLLAQKIYQSRKFKTYYIKKKSLEHSVKKPFKKIINLAKKLSKGEIEKTTKESKKNLKKFKDKLPSFPSKRYNISPEDEDFLDRHPIIHSLYLGCKGIMKLPKFVLKAPRAVFRIVFPAAYARSGTGKAVGAGTMDKVVSYLNKSPILNTINKNIYKFMQMPGVSIAIAILGPVLGVNRMIEGFVEYNKGLKTENHDKILEGKVGIMIGALASIKPLALLAVVTEGVHLFLSWKVRKHKMNPRRADEIMTNISAAVTAPIGLAAYALLSPSEAKNKQN